MGVSSNILLVQNPSKISTHLITIADKAALRWDELLVKRSFFSDIRNGVKLRVLYSTEYIRIKGFIDSFSCIDLDLASLSAKFSQLAEIIAENNLLLTYAYLHDKEKLKEHIITKEEEMLTYMKKFASDEVSFEDFKNRFGHYALNAFELSSKRFSDYSSKELKSLARFTRNITVKDGVDLSGYMHIRSKFQIYNALREELKYIALKVVFEMRKRLLLLEKKRNIKDIFTLSFDEAIQLEKHVDR